MDDNGFKLISESFDSARQAPDIMEKILAASGPDAVYGEPLTVGDYTIITASEVSLGGGFGYGGGLGIEEADNESDEGNQTAGGVGGGGGGGSTARPVAVISVSPEGVEVEPIFDVTKIAIAAFTALGSMFVMFNQMKRGK